MLIEYPEESEMTYKRNLHQKKRKMPRKSVEWQMDIDMSKLAKLIDSYRKDRVQWKRIKVIYLIKAIIVGAWRVLYIFF